MRPIPANSLGHAHGLLRAIDKRGRLRTDEFVTEFSLEELFPPDLENALGRLRHFISYARAAGLVKEDRGVVELTDVGRRYIRAGDSTTPFEISPQQAEWLRRQLREKHMTDSIFHGLAIGLSLLASCPPGKRVSTMDFGRSMAYLGRAGWDNENTLEIQGERHLLLLQEMEMIDGEHRLTPTGEQVRGELTLPVHMSLIDIAGQLNPGGPDAVAAQAAAEWEQTPIPVEPAAPPEPPEEENGYHTVGQGAVAPSDAPARPPIVPRSDRPSVADSEPPPAKLTPGDPLAQSVPPPVADAAVELAPDESAVSSVPPPVAAAPSPVAPDDSVVASVSPPVVGAPVETPPVLAPDEDEVSSVPPPVVDAPVETRPEVAPDEGAVSSVPPPIVDVPVEPPTPVELAETPPVIAPDDDAISSVPPPVEPADTPPADAPPDDAVSSVPPPVAPVGDVVSSGPPPVADAPGETPPVDEAVSSAPPPVVESPPPAPPVERVAVSVPPPAERAVPAPPVSAPPPPAVSGPAFVETWAIRAAAEAAGLRLPPSVYANVAAALTAGKHLVLTGAPGSGKTTLALAVTRAAAQAGRAHGATVVTSAPDTDLLVEAAGRGRWVIVDELDQADPDVALGVLSTFLSGVPVTLNRDEEAAPADGWRIVATWNGGPPRGAVLRRFAVIEVASPPADELRSLVHQAAGGDPAASRAAGTLLALAERAPLGAGVFLDAARHAAARNAAVPADEATLAREAFAAYIAPLHPDLEGP